MQFSEVERLAHEAYERGDIFGYLRLWSDFIAETDDKVAEGNARLSLADMWVRLGGAHPLRARTELEKARRMLTSPGDVAKALAVAVAIAVGENDQVATDAAVARLREHLGRHPGNGEVSKWWPRIRTWLARLAVAHGDHQGAIEHLRQAMAEVRTMEADSDMRALMIRHCQMLLAMRYLTAGDLLATRRCLDDSDGALRSANAEALRACYEAEYHMAVGNLERARFFVRLAKSWSSGQPEGLVQTAYVEAKLAYAAGNLKMASLLTIEARRLAALHKQDALSDAIRALGKEVCFAAVAEQKTDTGGNPHAQSGVGTGAGVPGGYGYR